jgi:very-short-patch-repair endonuclease
VFTSIRADDIDLNATQSQGVAALKMFLHYAEHGHLDAAESKGDADSLFEEQVAAVLRQRGLQVDHQIGVGGFLIDLAIRDPERNGRYLLGIECDGAQYHSARWVRDRDRIRQQVLESRGWIIHRIWSTDWFQRPQEQVEKVLDALAKAQQHWGKVDQAAAESATVIAGRVKVNQSETSPLWERLEVREDDAPGYRSENVYHEASFTIDGFHGGPADLTTEQLARLMEGIVKIEAPIQVHEVGRRCIAILGQGRLVKSLKQKLAAAAELLQRQGAAELRDDFLYRKDQAEFPVRNRRELDNANLRKVETIAPEELQTAIIEVVTEHIGTDEAETYSSVAKRLGISNTKPFREAIQLHIEQLTNDSRIAEKSGKLFAG